MRFETSISTAVLRVTLPKSPRLWFQIGWQGHLPLRIRRL
jgi:hypothetical protein